MLSPSASVVAVFPYALKRQNKYYTVQNCLHLFFSVSTIKSKASFTKSSSAALTIGPKNCSNEVFFERRLERKSNVGHHFYFPFKSARIAKSSGTNYLGKWYCYMDTDGAGICMSVSSHGDLSVLDSKPLC